MQTLNRQEFIDMITKNKKGYEVEIEDRVKLGYNTYGICNHAEFIHYMNPHDNCYWDAIIPGYDYIIPSNKIYIVKNILGYVYIPNGNYKIIIDLGLDNFNSDKFMTDLEYFIDEYSKINNNIETKLIIF